MSELSRYPLHLSPALLLLSLSLLVTSPVINASESVRVCKGANNTYTACGNGSSGPSASIESKAPASDAVTAGKTQKSIEAMRNKDEKLRADREALHAAQKALEDAQNQLLRRKKEFSLDAQIPEMGAGGRNFARFLAKMHAREGAVKLAKIEFEASVVKLDKILQERGLPPSNTTPRPNPDLYDWADQYWQEVKTEVSELRQKELVERKLGIRFD